MSRVRKYILISVISVSLYGHIALGTDLNPIIKLLLFDDMPESVSCNHNIDTDGDRLSDCFETNTGIFVNTIDTGTDPDNADTDGDGISDGDEVLGTLAGLMLQQLGANPLRKNIFVEYDWFNDANECGPHSHRPTKSMMNKVALAFSRAPLENPDGSTGIFLIQDFGQGGVFTGGNRIDDSNGVLGGGIKSSEFQTHKLANFQANRIGYFHYVLLPHRYDNTSNSSGQAELPGDDSIVSLYCFYDNTQFVTSAIMHELGHNLNLRHGGDVHCNYKPNYNSVMNYRYEFAGIDKSTSCDAQGDGVLAYSRGNRIDLNESLLNEFDGVCRNNPVDIDWNFNGVISGPVSVDINIEAINQFKHCGGILSILKDHDDWNNLQFMDASTLDRMQSIIQEIITETNIPG